MCLLLVLTASLLAACGFHAAGARTLPEQLERVHIDLIAPYRVSEPQVETRMRALLTQRGTEVVDKAGADVAAKGVEKAATMGQEQITVGADGKALEYDLILRMEYQMYMGDTVYIPLDQIEVRRDYSFNPGQLLAKEQEAQRLRDYLENQMAELLLLRIEILLRQAPPPEAERDEAPVAPAAATSPAPPPGASNTPRSH